MQEPLCKSFDMDTAPLREGQSRGLSVTKGSNGNVFIITVDTDPERPIQPYRVVGLPFKPATARLIAQALLEVADEQERS